MTGPACGRDKHRTAPASTTASAARGRGAAPALVSLEPSLEPLRSFFNEAQGKNRLVALLSPSCTECRNGGRLIRQEVLAEAPPDRWAIAIVWIPMRPTDEEHALREAAQEVAHPRIRQYFDAERRAGWACARAAFPAFQAPAWDVFLFWNGAARWQAADPPPPAERLAQFRGPGGKPLVASEIDDSRRPIPLAPSTELGTLLKERTQWLTSP